MQILHKKNHHLKASEAEEEQEHDHEDTEDLRSKTFEVTNIVERRADCRKQVMITKILTVFVN